MKFKAIAALVVAAVLAAGAWWYWSPYVAMRSMMEAARERDAQRFNGYVDYARLRESLKMQIGARVGDSLGGRDRDVGGRAMSALGAMLATALADRFIDAMVRPDVVMRAMTQARMQAPVERGGRRRNDEGDAGGREGPEGTPGGDGEGGDAARNGESRDVDWQFEREGVDRMVAWGGRPGVADAQRTGFVFERSGFAAWRLTEIRIP